MLSEGRGRSSCSEYTLDYVVVGISTLAMAIGGECRKFVPNIFNKTKCSNCYKLKSQVSPRQLSAPGVGGGGGCKTGPAPRTRKKCTTHSDDVGRSNRANSYRQARRRHAMCNDMPHYEMY